MSFIEQQLATSTIDEFLGDAKPPTVAMKKLMFLHVLVKVIGMLLTFDLLLLK